MTDERNREEVKDDERAHYMKDKCKQYMNYHVLVETNDGKKFDAILTGHKGDQVEMLVPEMMEPESYERSDSRQYGPRFRRFGRFLLPLAALTALSLIPYRPYPYYPYYPPYPYYPYY
ncbi:hypothetical protein [Alkalihalobacillus sp. AL-G]|uniref:hypothetical protein n=1 Tax=Alkalihalobacillus sp. AL-G TaxID=2926399 RepID=UPI00272BB880|nr:hypothetical protein [Alkalihalobacillus sp. AL-G]WLD94119.1 hypothetical protein MOJ78_04285 [Alkalihalobacillus sp. AL-G]